MAFFVIGNLKNLNRYENRGYETRYGYDPMGNRLKKEKFITSSNTGESTYYVRDAQGNVMATYEYKSSDKSKKLKELHIYGSSRLGMKHKDMVLSSNTDIDYANTRGQKSYELSNHFDERNKVSERNQTVSNCLME